MESKLNSDCWYKDVCQMDNSCDSCIRFLEMKYLMDNSGLPKARQIPAVLVPDDIDYDSFVQLNEIKNKIVEYVTGGGNIYIGGHTTGNGKTSWAIKLLLKYFDEIWAGNGFRPRGVFVHVPTLLLRLKDFDDHDTSFLAFKRRLQIADLVVWDEIAGTDLSKFDYSQLLALIDIRAANYLANVFTGNLERRDEVVSAMGDRLASRIWNASEVIILRGRDKR